MVSRSLWKHWRGRHRLRHQTLPGERDGRRPAASVGRPPSENQIIVRDCGESEGPQSDGVQLLSPSADRIPIEIVAIGTWTGGPNALAELIPQLPASFPVPDRYRATHAANLTRRLAERLDALTPLHVREAKEGKKTAAGSDMDCAGRLPHECGALCGRCCIDDEPAAARTGMPTCGRRAFPVRGGNVRRARVGHCAYGHGGRMADRSASNPGSGREVIVQDEATSVIWGMPGSVVAAGQADEFSTVLIVQEVVRKSHRQPRPQRRATGGSREIARLGQKKKRLERNAQDPLRSPPPELPNHVMILCPLGSTVNVTYVTSRIEKGTAGVRHYR